MSIVFVYAQLNIEIVLFQTIQFSISVNVKIILFQAIKFCISTEFSSIWPIDRILSGATTPGQSGPGSDGNELVLLILQSTSIIETSSSNCLYHHIYQLLRSGKIWHKVNFFKRSLTGLNSEFSFS